MSENPIVGLSLSSCLDQNINRRTESTNSSPAGNVNQSAIIRLSESNADNISAAEKHLEYFRLLNSDVLSDWEEECKALAEIDTDNLIQSRLKYYHKFVNFMCSDRVIALTIFLQVYYIIVFGFVLIYSEKYSQTVFYVSITIIYAFSILCIKTVKGKIFGKIISKTKDVASIGYYQLLNMKYNYIESQQTVNARKDSVGIISSKFVRDIGFYRSTS